MHSSKVTLYLHLLDISWPESELTARVPFPLTHTDELNFEAPRSLYDAACVFIKCYLEHVYPTHDVSLSFDPTA